MIRDLITSSPSPTTGRIHFPGHVTYWLRGLTGMSRGVIRFTRVCIGICVMKYLRIFRINRSKMSMNPDHTWTRNLGCIMRKICKFRGFIIGLIKKTYLSKDWIRVTITHHRFVLEKSYHRVSKDTVSQSDGLSEDGQWIGCRIEQALNYSDPLLTRSPSTALTFIQPKCPITKFAMEGGARLRGVPERRNKTLEVVERVFQNPHSTELSSLLLLLLLFFASSILAKSLPIRRFLSAW